MRKREKENERGGWNSIDLFRDNFIEEKICELDQSTMFASRPKITCAVNRQFLRNYYSILPLLHVGWFRSVFIWMITFHFQNQIHFPHNRTDNTIYEGFLSCAEVTRLIFRFTHAPTQSGWAECGRRIGTKIDAFISWVKYERWSSSKKYGMMMMMMQ